MKAKTAAKSPASRASGPSAIFTAMIAAAKGDCKCKTCGILRNIGDEMIEEYAKVLQ